MKNLSLISIMLLLVLFISSCKEEETPDNTYKKGLITKVFNGSTINREIQYNASDRPEKMLLYGSTGYPNGYSTYDFGDDTLVDKIQNYSQQSLLTGFSTFLYDTLKRLLTKKYYVIQGTNTKLSYSEAFFYNSNNQLTHFSEFDSTGNVKYFQNLIYDTLDDPSEVKYYSPDNSYAGSIYYTYDNSPNSFAGYNKKLGTSHPYNKHNIKSITSSQTPVNGVVTFILGTTTIKVTLYSSTFEYDANNLPTKEVRTYQSGSPGTFIYEYK